MLPLPLSREALRAATCALARSGDPRVLAAGQGLRHRHAARHTQQEQQHGQAAAAPGIDPRRLLPPGAEAAGRVHDRQCADDQPEGRQREPSRAAAPSPQPPIAGSRATASSCGQDEGSSTHPLPSSPHAARPPNAPRLPAPPRPAAPSSAAGEALRHRPPRFPLCFHGCLYQDGNHGRPVGTLPLKPCSLALLHRPRPSAGARGGARGHLRMALSVGTCAPHPSL